MNNQGIEGIILISSKGFNLLIYRYIWQKKIFKVRPPSNYRPFKKYIRQHKKESNIASENAPGESDFFVIAQYLSLNFDLI